MPDGGQGARRLARVRKLLAKAERAGTAEEAAVYTAKAVELVARHGIDAALLAARHPDGGGAGDEIGATRVEVGPPYGAGKARLLGWTAAALGCRVVLHQVGGGRVTAVTVFGFAVDRARVELLFGSLLVQAVRELARCRPPGPGESVAAYRRSWLHGFAAQVHARLTEAERRAAESVRGPGAAGAAAAPVLADRRARVERAHAEAFPGLRRGRRPALTGSGFPAGARAGERADLGAPRVAARRALGA